MKSLSATLLVNLSRFLLRLLLCDSHSSCLHSICTIHQVGDARHTIIKIWVMQLTLLHPHANQQVTTNVSGHKGSSDSLLFLSMLRFIHSFQPALKKMCHFPAGTVSGIWSLQICFHLLCLLLVASPNHL